MNKPDQNGFDKYFSFRNVGPDYYGNYVIPKYLKLVLPADSDAEILDIGCGFGQMLNAFRAEGYRCLSGIDISDEAVLYCTASGLNVTKIDNIFDFCQKADKRYDLIVMSHVIEHIEKVEIIDTLRAVRLNLLTERGCVVVMVPNAQSNTGCYWAYEDFSHTTLFTAGSLYYVLRAAEFNEINFLDPKGVEGMNPLLCFFRLMLLGLYKLNFLLWNIVTGSSFHKPSPQIFTYELKALAK